MAIRDSSPGQPPAGRLTGGRIGVLLLNLGTPEATSYWPMRRYLKEFLSDRRVIEEPRWKWWPILNLVILSIRPGRKGKDYDKIWNRERNESPLKTITRAQAEKLAAALPEGRVVVDWAMRYGNPAVGPALARLQQQSCDRILLLPLYPQYAAATTATACDQVFRALMDVRWQPSIRVVPPYYADPAYIDALATSMRRHLSTLDFKPDVLLASFHGMPLKYFENGDPYYLQCEETSALLRKKLDWPVERWRTTYQSRFGFDKWLEPATIDTVADLARTDVKKIALVAPGFAADCLETLEELAMENRNAFLQAGGEKFACIPCLNDSPEHIGMLAQLVRRELLGWL
jgi:ferrochelatase